MITATAKRLPAMGWVASVDQENEVILIQTSTEEGAHKIAQAINTFAHHVIVIDKE